jgi:hypothetical protein
MDITVNQSLVVGSTYLSKDYIAASTSFTVENTEQFTAANGLVVFGMIGTSNAELIATLSSKTATVLNMGSGCVFQHNRGEPVSQVTYNKVIIESSTSSTGTFAVIATIDLQWSSDKTSYNDTAGTSATYYRQRFYNTVTGIYSDYSNGGVGVSQNDLGPTTVSSLILSVRTAVGNTELTDAFFISALNDARRIADTSFGYGRLNEWRHNFEYPIQMLAGTNFVTLPSNIDFTETNRTLLAARYARQSVAANVPLKYVDKREWNQRAYLNRYSITVGSTLSGATSIVLSSTGDFPAAGTLMIATELPTQSILSVTYTANNLITNTLSGCSGITRNIAAGTQVWAYSTFAVPYFFTVFDDQSGNHKLWFDRPIPAGLQGKNLYIDYYKKITDMVFMSDVIPEHYRDVYKDYLKFAIKRRRDDSIGADDQDYKNFMAGLANILGNPYTGQSQIIIQ